MVISYFMESISSILQRAAILENRQDDCQPHGGLRRGDNHYEKRIDVTVHLLN